MPALGTQEFVILFASLAPTVLMLLALGVLVWKVFQIQAGVRRIEERLDRKP